MKYVWYFPLFSFQFLLQNITTQIPSALTFSENPFQIFPISSLKTLLFLNSFIFSFRMKVLINLVKKIFNIVFLLLSPVRRLICRRRRHSDTPILPLTTTFPTPPAVPILPPTNEVSHHFFTPHTDTLTYFKLTVFFFSCFC